MLHYQSMHDETLKKNTYLIWVHIFFVYFLIESHYFDHPLFKQVFFRKKFFSCFLIIFNMVYFLSAAFYSRHANFFANFQSPKNIFLKKMNTTLVFRFFFFYSNKALFYFEEETTWETIFLYFFGNSKHIFCFDKSQIFWILTTPYY